MDADEQSAAGGESAVSVTGTGVRVVRPSLTSLLVEAGVASEEQLRVAVAEGMGSGRSLGELVLEKGWIDEDGLARLLARQWGLDFLEDATLELDAVEPASAERICELGGRPVAVEAGVVVVAVAEPTTGRLNEVRAAVEGEVRFAVVTPSSFSRLADELAAARAAEVEQEAAAAADAAAASRSESLVGELQAATATLSGLLGRVEQLTSGRDLAEQQLAETRRQLESRDEQHASALQSAEERLARRDEQLALVRQTLTELLGRLDPPGEA